MKKKYFLSAAFCAAVLALAGCTREPKAVSSEEAVSSEISQPAESGSVSMSSDQVQEPKQFTDDTGKMITVPENLERIVPAGSVAQNILFALAPEKFAGMAIKWPKAAGDYISESYLALPVLGQLYGQTELNIESLAAAGPQLIVDAGERKKSLTKDMENVEKQTAIPTVHIDATLATMGDAYRKLGKLLGNEEKAEQLAEFCDRIYNRTVKMMEKVGDKKVKALYVLGEEGLNVLAKGSFHGEQFDLLVDNVAVVDKLSPKGTGNEVTMEQIAAWAPEVVVFAPDSIYDDVAERETWRDMDAIAQHRYIRTPIGPQNWMSNPPSVQRLLSLIWLGKALYPEYADYDMKADVKTYFKLFYHTDLTDAQYDALTRDAFIVK